MVYLGFPKIVGDIIINRMIKNKKNDMIDMFLKYFIPLFQTEINIVKFGCHNASLKEVIDFLFVIYESAGNKNKDIPLSLELTQDKESDKKHHVVINQLGLNDLTNYINNDITNIKEAVPKPKKEKENNSNENKPMKLSDIKIAKKESKSKIKEYITKEQIYALRKPFDDLRNAN